MTFPCPGATTRAASEGMVGSGSTQLGAIGVTVDSNDPDVPDTGTLRADLLTFFETIRPLFRNLELRAATLDLRLETATFLDLVHDVSGSLGGDCTTAGSRLLLVCP